MSSDTKRGRASNGFALSRIPSLGPTPRGIQLMRRGELYRVRHPAGDPKRSRVFVVVSRQALLDSSFSGAVCAPVFSEGQALSTQVPVGVDEGLKHDSAIFCDNLVSIAKALLTDYIGALSPAKLSALNGALRLALEL